MLRALHLGDLLCATPALRALRRHYPHAHISLIGLPWAREFAARYPHLLDEFIEFPGWPGVPEGPQPDDARLAAFFDEMRARRLDLAIQMHGAGDVTNAFVAELGARTTAGFVPSPDAQPRPDVAVPYPDDVPEPRRHLALVRALGADATDDRLEFPVADADRAALRMVPGAPALEGRRYAVIHPGSRDPARRWPPDRFAAVAAALASDGIAVVYTGSARERGIVEAARCGVCAPSLDLSGQTDLGMLAALIEGAALVVCNDTGVSHLAAAVRTPSVVVFTASDPRRWAPANAVRHRPVLPAERDEHGVPRGLPPLDAVVEAAFAQLALSDDGLAAAGDASL